MAGRAEALSQDARADVIGDSSLRSPKAKGCVSLQSLPRVAASAPSLCRPVWPLSPDRFFLSVSQLTDHPGTIDYCPVMRQMDFYFHDSCLSRQSVLLLAREIQQDCPAWHIAIHPLLEHEVKALGFHVLPTIVMNGSTVAAGVPKKDWLLERMKECERADRQ